MHFRLILILLCFTLNSGLCNALINQPINYKAFADQTCDALTYDTLNGQAIIANSILEIIDSSLVQDIFKSYKNTIFDLNESLNKFSPKTQLYCSLQRVLSDKDFIKNIRERLNKKFNVDPYIIDFDLFSLGFDTIDHLIQEKYLETIQKLGEVVDFSRGNKNYNSILTKKQRYKSLVLKFISTLNQIFKVDQEIITFHLFLIGITSYSMDDYKYYETLNYIDKFLHHLIFQQKDDLLERLFLNTKLISGLINILQYKFQVKRQIIAFDLFRLGFYAKNDFKFTELMRAASLGDLDEIDNIINNLEFPDLIDETDIYGSTALFWAILYNKIEATEKLLSRNANPNHQDAKGNTPLITSTFRFYKNTPTDIIKLLLKYGAEPQIANAELLTPILTAVKSNNLPALNELVLYFKSFQEEKEKDFNIMLKEQRLLEQNSLNINLNNSQNINPNNLEHLAINYLDMEINQSNNEGCTALMFALKNKREDIIDFLLTNGVDIDLKTYKNQTTLMKAAYYNLNSYLEKFITNDSPINEQDKAKNTALIYAVCQNNFESTLKLLQLGADPNIKGEHESTALIVAVKNKAYKCVDILLKYGANINSQDSKGNTALICAINNDSQTLKNQLLGYYEINNDIAPNFGINLQNKLRNTALILATENGDIDTVIRLLKLNANTNIQGSDGMSALMIATKNRSYDIVYNLLKAGANPNLQNDNGCSALHYAALKKSYTLTGTLLNYGANKKLKDNDGRTATIIARCQEDFDVANLLIKHS